MTIAGLFNRGALYARTLRHVRPVQVVNRLRRLIPPRPDLAVAPPLRRRESQFLEPCERPVRLSGDNFRFLGVERPITWAADCDAPLLWQYNLHYFDDLISTGARDRRSLHGEFVDRWVRDAEPGVGVGWAPYPISLRMVNWIKWHLLGASLSDGARHSLAIQARFLASSLEYHLLANHLWANAKALIFAGLFFEGREAECWLRKGARILEREIAVQILPDGGHFELSPMYHAIVTEDLLDLIHIGTAFGWVDVAKLRQTVSSALAWHAAMVRPDGKFPLFNDAAYGVASDCVSIADYARRLGIDYPAAPGFAWLADTGYARVVSEDFALFADLGAIGPDYNPGHGHCDMLSFELCLRGRSIVVDTGTSTYDVSARRLRERSTAAHNTIQFGANEQSEIWGAFRVGRRARMKVYNVDRDCLEGSHNGFLHLHVWHRRRFRPEPARLVI